MILCLSHLRSEEVEVVSAHNANQLEKEQCWYRRCIRIRDGTLQWCRERIRGDKRERGDATENRRPECFIHHAIGH